MQTSPLNIWGLQPADVTPTATGKAESGFEGILNQTIPTGETMTAGILGETGLEAGSNGPIALDQELDHATESQTSSDLIALMMTGLPAPQASDAGLPSLANLAVVTMVSAPAEATPSDLLAKKEVRLEAPARGENAPAVQTASLTGIELPEGLNVLDQPAAFEGELPEGLKILDQPVKFEGEILEFSPVQAKAESSAVSLLAAKSAQTEEVVAPAAEHKTDGAAIGIKAEADVSETSVSQTPRTAVEAALPEEKLPFVKTNDPIGQLLNERWQAWVKQNYAGPLTAQSPAPMMPAAMNTAFSAAAQTGQISLAQAEVKPVLAAAPVYSAVVTTTEGDSTQGALDGEAVAVPTSTQANPNLGGAFNTVVRSTFKPLAGQNEAFGQTEATTFEEELSEVLETEAGSDGQATELTAEQTRLQGKDQVQTQSQPLSLTEEKAVAKQASKTLQDMIEAHQAKTTTIRLNPDELGSLTIKVRQFGHRVEAEVSASLDSVRQALNSHKQELAAAVENRGAQLTNLVIKSESTATDSQTNNSFSQNGNSGDGRSHQEAQQEANRFARLTAANAPVSETQPERTQVRTGRTSRFDLTA